MIELTDQDINVIKDLSYQMSASPSLKPDIFCKQAKTCSKFLPDRIKSEIDHFVNHGSESGFLLIRKVPMETIPVTPTTNDQKKGETTFLAKVQATFLQYMGEMISYEAEGYGRLFQDVIPVEKMSKQQTSISSVELELHTEQAFSELRPDILSLACLRGDANAKTYILPVHKIIENMTKEECDLLKQPLWYTEVDLSFKMNGNEFIKGDIRGPLPIHLANDRLLFDQDLMKGTTSESCAIIQKIIDIYKSCRESHCLQPGDIIFIDNNRAVHGRSSFSPKYDGKDRFLIRCFSAFDLEKSAYARPNNGRTISAIYS
jgi:L-asparagine oxygenase